MHWLSLLFMHWRAPLDVVRAMQPRIPAALEIDAFDGSAWVGLIPFTMRDVRPVWGPRLPGARIRGVSDFHECNVRTYVTFRGEPGVWFFSLDAASRLAVAGARSLWKLPYHLARMDLRSQGDMVHYSVNRRDQSGALMRCAWRIGAPRATSQPGDLAWFLTERYALFTLDRAGRIHRCRVQHDRWSLREAEVLELEDGLVAAAGWTPPAGQPIAWHADELSVRASMLERVSDAPKGIGSHGYARRATNEA